MSSYLMIKWLAEMAVGYVIGYFCRRAVLKKQCFTVVWKPVLILGCGTMCIMAFELLFMTKMGLLNVMGFGKVYDNFGFLMDSFPLIAAGVGIGFIGKKDDYIAAESASGTARTMSPAFEKKLNCALAAFLVLFAVGFWIVSTGN